jgi:hypothetical protein
MCLMPGFLSTASPLIFKSLSVASLRCSYVTSHLLCNLPRVDHSGQLPRDLISGHDPSLGAPIPGHHRARRWSKSSALRHPVTGSQTLNCFLPSHCHITQRRPFTLYYNASSNNVSVCPKGIVLRQRVVTVTYRAGWGY